MSKVSVVLELAKHDSVLFKSIVDALKKHNVEVDIIEDTKNIWCRDYMPIPTHNAFVRFNFQKYMNCTQGFEYPQLEVSEKVYAKLPPELKPRINIENGGNIVYNDNYAILTDNIFQDNEGSQSDLIRKIENLLSKQVIIIPSEPGDYLGHADGIVKFIDNKTVFFNDYSCLRKGKLAEDYEYYYETYQYKVTKILEAAGLTVIPFPYAYDKCPEIFEETFRKEHPLADDFNPGFGYYINFLITKEVILFPTFDLPQDDEVEKLLKEYYKRPVEGIDCRFISMEGGLVNCLTWNFDYDNI